jgi:hypothetical protein
MTNKFTCIDCGSTDVEVCLPAWFNPNKKLKFVECDAVAEALSIFCNDCEDTTGLSSPNGQVITGRW